MRGLFGIIGIFGGLGLLAYGIGSAVGWFDGGSPVAAIIGGIFGLLIGVLIVRAMGIDRDEAGPYPQAPEPEDVPMFSPEPAETVQDMFERPVSADPTDPYQSPSRAGVGRGILVRAIAFVVIGLFIAGGPGRVFDAVSNLFGDDPPNVPVHVLDACNEALRVELGPAASYGTAYEYLQATDGTNEVRFRTKQGFEWDCQWDPATFEAEILATRQAD